MLRRVAHDAKDRTKNRVKTRVMRHVEEGSTIETTRQLVNRGVAAAQTLTKGIDESWLQETPATNQVDSSYTSSISPLSAVSNRVQLHIPSTMSSIDGEIATVREIAVKKPARELEIRKHEIRAVAHAVQVHPEVRESALEEQITEPRDLKEASAPVVDSELASSHEIEGEARVEETEPEVEPKVETEEPKETPQAPQSQQLDFRPRDENPQVPPLPQKSQAKVNTETPTGWDELNTELQHHTGAHNQAHQVAESLSLFPAPSSSVAVTPGPSNSRATVNGNRTSDNDTAHDATGHSSDTARDATNATGNCSGTGPAHSGSADLKGNYKPKYVGPVKTASMLSHWDTLTPFEYTPAPTPTHLDGSTCTPQRWGHEKVRYYGVGISQ